MLSINYWMLPTVYPAVGNKCGLHVFSECGFVNNNIFNDLAAKNYQPLCG